MLYKYEYNAVILGEYLGSNLNFWEKYFFVNVLKKKILKTWPNEMIAVTYETWVHFSYLGVVLEKRTALILLVFLGSFWKKYLFVEVLKFRDYNAWKRN